MLKTVEQILYRVVPERYKPPLRSIRNATEDSWYALRGYLSRVNPRPVLVLGNQKSGTSAIAALLGDLTGLSVTIDLPREIRHAEYLRVLRGEITMREFVALNRHEFSRDIIKEPNLTLLYEELAEFFPEASFAYVVRDPRDNLRSMLNRLKIRGDLEKLSGDVKERIPHAWRLVLDGPRLGLTGRNYIEVLAQRWNLMMDVYLNNADRMVCVRYKDFLADKEGTITRLSESLELPRVRDDLERADVQFQPRGDRSVSWIDFFKEKNLARIERICRDRMIQVGYKPL